MAGVAFWGLVKPPRRPEPTGQFIDVDGLTVHYEILGDGPPAIAIHGAGGNLRDWTMGPAREMARTHRVLVMDRPGHGFSDRPAKDGERLSVQAGLLRKAALELGFEGAVLAGHSYGGSVSLTWALDAPETLSGLILLGAPSQVWEGGVDKIYAVTGNPVFGGFASSLLPRLISTSYVESAISGVFKPEAPPEQYGPRLGVELSLQPPSVQANAHDIRALKAQVRAMVPRYPGLDLPVELIHGSDDLSVPAPIHSDKLANQLPRLSAYQRIEGAGHMIHHTQTDALVTALTRLSPAS